MKKLDVSAAMPASAIFSKDWDGQGIEFYVVPEKPSNPYCDLWIGTDWTLSKAEKAELSHDLLQLGQGIAEGIQLSP